MTRVALVASLALFYSCGLSQAEVGSGMDLAESDAELRNTSYNCNRDKHLDVAGSFTVEVLSSARIRLRMTQGSDAAGIGGYSYTVSGGGVTESFEAQRLTCFGYEVLDDGTIDGLVGDTDYTVTLSTSDKCGNVSTSTAQALRTPARVQESAGPTIASFSLTSVNWFGSQVPVLLALAEDNTGMDKVEFYADGTLVGSHSLKITGGLWPRTMGFYKAPGFQFYTYPTRGQTHSFEARAYDVFGNTSSTVKTFTIP